VRVIAWVRLLTSVFVASLLCLHSRSTAQEAKLIKIHEGKHWVWFARSDQFESYGQDIERFYDYADKAFEYLCEAWGLKLPREKYVLFVWPKTGGGFATGDIAEVRAVTGKESPGIGVSYDAFFNVVHGIKGYWAYVLITHEMVNLFTGQIVSGGWPVDWWANHRSPFPLVTAVQIEYALVPEVAIHHAKQITADPLCRMFQKLKDQYGWHLFRKAFQMAREDGINWERIGTNPSKLRTNYVCAYLQMAAPEDLTPYFNGFVPNFDLEMVASTIKARERWRSLPEGDSKRKELQALFLSGNYEACLKLNEPVQTH
jgi:hypothetical protein